MLYKFLTNSFLLFGILLFVVGCSEHQDENITTIETVLKHQFTGPDLKLIGLLDSPENAPIIGKEVETSTEEPKTPTKLDLYLEARYKPHFTESMYSRYVATYALDYQVAASKSDYQLEVDGIDIEQNETNEDADDFTVKVLYKKEESENDC